MQDMQVSELVARMRVRADEMRTTAEEYEIEARFHADKALDLRLGVMELNQLINSVQEFVDGEPDQTPADSRPGSEVAASDAAAISAGGESPSSSPAPHSAAPEPLSVDGTDPAKLAAEEVSAETSGEVQDRCESTSPPFSEPQQLEPADLSEAAPLEAVAAAPEAVPPAPVRERVQALHDAHPEYTARQAREALDITKGSLSGHSSALGITWAPAEFIGRPVGSMKSDKVRMVHEQHPTWTARMIANHLGEKEASVSTMLATIRKRAAASTTPEPEFSGRSELVGHYSDVAKRLGKV